MRIDRHHFSSLDSTNSWARRALETLDREALTVITADSQTGGRGRHGRVWQSPAGVNLYMTCVLFCDRDPAELTQVLACAVAEVTGARVKWPNDLMLGGRKLAGILCEAVDTARIVGVGVNVNMEAEALDQIDQPATSLLLSTGSAWSLDALRDDIVSGFLRHLARDFSEIEQQIWSAKALPSLSQKAALPPVQ